jgi:hypothetical protein
MHTATEEPVPRTLAGPVVPIPVPNRRTALVKVGAALKAGRLDAPRKEALRQRLHALLSDPSLRARTDQGGPAAGPARVPPRWLRKYRHKPWFIPLGRSASGLIRKSCGS